MAGGAPEGSCEGNGGVSTARGVRVADNCTDELTGGDGSGSSRGKAAAAIRVLGRRCWDEVVQGVAWENKNGGARGLGIGLRRGGPEISAVRCAAVAGAGVREERDDEWGRAVSEREKEERS
jgi:hypothetical protein